MPSKHAVHDYTIVKMDGIFFNLSKIMVSTHSQSVTPQNFFNEKPLACKKKLKTFKKCRALWEL